MDEIKVVINGVKYRVIPDEVENVEDDERSKTGYERVEENERYYCAGFFNNTDFDDEIGSEGDKHLYETANYYSDEAIAENNARADKLMRQLRQWQALNDKPVDWTDPYTEKWHIMYSYDHENLKPVSCFYMREFSTVYFSTKEKAEKATEVFKDDLTWYFTEYISRLDEPRIG